MITEYKVKCPCGFKANVEYGREGKDKIIEVYSCPVCKSLFSISFEEEVICKKCGNTKLISYNPNKKENLAFYEKMDVKLTKPKITELQKFWATIYDDMCPNCGKITLSWQINAKSNKE